MDPWERLNAAASASLNWAWEDLAQCGEESALFAPMAESPEAAGWLAGCMAMSDDSITRKLAAMLAGWLVESKFNRDLLGEMLQRERQRATSDMLEANSVVEDILLAATRWASGTQEETRSAGRAVLSEIVRDALLGTKWNTAHWAFANLHFATDGTASIIAEAIEASSAQLADQPYLEIAIEGIRSDNLDAVSQYVTPPIPVVELASDNPGRPFAIELWDAVAEAEIAANA
ncbi:MAG: hypothetical protein Aurels2KO_40310 [Aureliella sp.]